MASESSHACSPGKLVPFMAFQLLKLRERQKGDENDDEKDGCIKSKAKRQSKERPLTQIKVTSNGATKHIFP